MNLFRVPTSAFRVPALSHQLIGPISSSSAVNRPGPTRVIVAKSSDPMAVCWARSPRAIARTCATPSRLPTLPRGGDGAAATCARRFSISSPRISRRVPRSSLPGWEARQSPRGRAHAAAGGGRGSGSMRGEILCEKVGKLATRGEEFAARVGRQEVAASIARLFTYAAWADKWDGAVHHTPIRGVTLAMNEPVGVLGIAAPDEFPLLGFVSLVAPAIAVGNTVIVIPSEPNPLAATEFYTVLETSDVPSGVINVITGAKDALAKVLAEHDDADGMWYFGTAAGVKAVELASAANMKRTWTSARTRDWLDTRQGEGREFLRHASEVKNIWIPYGE